MNCLICSEEMVRRESGNHVCNQYYTKDIGHSFYKPDRAHAHIDNGYVIIYVNPSNITIVSNTGAAQNVSIHTLIELKFLPKDKINFPVINYQISWDIVSEFVHKKDWLLKLEVFK